MLLRISGGKMVKSTQAFCGSRAASNVAIKLWLGEGGGICGVGGTVTVMGPFEEPEISWRALKSNKVRLGFVMVEIQIQGIWGEGRLDVVNVPIFMVLRSD